MQSCESILAEIESWCDDGPMLPFEDIYRGLIELGIDVSDYPNFKKLPKATQKQLLAVE